MSALRGRAPALPRGERLARQPAHDKPATAPAPPAPPKDIDPPTLHDALKYGAAAQVRTGGMMRELRDLILGRERNPELRILTFDGAAGVYELTDLARGFNAKSVTVYNPNQQAPVYVGFAGDSPTALANAFPVFQWATIPLQAVDLRLGIDPTVLGDNTATVFLLRWPTLRPFAAE